VRFSHKAHRRAKRPLLTLENAPAAFAQYAANHSESTARAVGLALRRIEQRNAKLRLRLAFIRIERETARPGGASADVLGGHEAPRC
jgi:hypothetical protein